jgi:hypothetical protein
MSCAVFRATKDVQESRERRGVCAGSVSRGQASLQQQAQLRRPTLLFCLVYEGPGQKSLDYRAPYQYGHCRAPKILVAGYCFDSIY